MDIRPVPTDSEAAAIAAAIALVTGDAGHLLGSEIDQRSRWRWSGRWWTKPIPLRRDRPW